MKVIHKEYSRRERATGRTGLDGEQATSDEIARAVLPDDKYSFLCRTKTGPKPGYFYSRDVLKMLDD